MADNNEISIPLKASNSSGAQKLGLTYELEDTPVFFFTLWGRMDGKYIQVDFDTMSLAELEDYRAAIDLIIEQAKG